MLSPCHLAECFSALHQFTVSGALVQYVARVYVVTSSDACHDSVSISSMSVHPQNASTSSKGKGRATASLTVEDILSDLSELPRPSPAVASQPVDLAADVPSSSESVESSLAISQALIDRSRALLEETNMLDTVHSRMLKVDEALGQVERELD